MTTAQALWRMSLSGSELARITREGDDLVLSDGTRFTLEPGQADKWLHAIQNPPSRLDKLGVKPGMTVVVDGVEDEAFRANPFFKGGEIDERLER